MVRFAHMADCHIGAWREQRMRELVDSAFADAITAIIEEEVDFVLIAGDLFHTALPGIEHIRHAVKHLGRLKREGIPVYLVAGSHDYSPTGKTMLSVLEEAGLATDVFRPLADGDRLSLGFVTDERTGIKLCGIPGRAGQLDKQLYERLDIAGLSAEPGRKIFLFHAALSDLTPPSMPLATRPISMLPRGFAYYAGGHVHTVNSKSLETGEAVYPGPLFPASFSELESLGPGGFFIVEGDDRLVKRRVDVPVAGVVPVSHDCSGQSPQQVEDSLRERLDQDLSGSLVLVRLSGSLSEGAAGDIDFRSLFARCGDRGAIYCMKNTASVSSPLIERELTEVASTDVIARDVVREFSGRVEVPGLSREQEEKLFLELLSVLSRSRADGEKRKEYDQRVSEEALQSLNG